MVSRNYLVARSRGYVAGFMHGVLLTTGVVGIIVWRVVFG